MLRLERGVVAAAGEPAPIQRLEVEIDGERRAAYADTGLVGASEPGDEVVVNVEAVALGLGSGGADVVLCNLTRGLGGAGTPGAHVMKLNYSPLQHAVLPVEEGAENAAWPPVARPGPVGAFFLHGQLAPAAWAAGARVRARIGFVQGAGGALPGALSDVVRELRGRGLLHRHVTAGACHGGEREAITVAGALAWGFDEDGWDAALVGPGPGILGSASVLGHGGMAALDALHAAAALGCRALVIPRMSSGDPRERHQGMSHHTRTVLSLSLADAVLALPPGEQAGAWFGDHAHELRPGRADLSGYAASGLPARTMGRGLEDDELFFAAALAGGDVLGAMIEDA